MKADVSTKKGDGKKQAEAAFAESRALFVRRWGEMGIYWGISRTMAEIHALLYISVEPKCTDDLMAELQISRGNASMNVRSLIDWGLVRRVHQRGDRKEYFTAETEVWCLFETIMRERRRRELEPIHETIRKCIEMVERESPKLGEADREGAREYQRRLGDMQAFLTTVSSMINVALEMGPGGMAALSGMLGSAAHNK